MFKWFGHSSQLDKIALQIYGSIVTQARSKAFYTDYGIADSPTGRFDMLTVHMILVLIRLQSEAEKSREISQLLSETFVRDMDHSLREMGIGDLSVAKRVRRMNNALLGQLRLYATLIDEAEAEPLAAALERNINTVETTEASDASHPDQAMKLSRYMRMGHKRIAEQAYDNIIAGEIAFPDPLDPNLNHPAANSAEIKNTEIGDNIHDGTH